MRITLASSSPDLRTGVPGQPLTFTATVSDPGPSGIPPTGSVTFEDTVYFVSSPGQLGSTTTVLAEDVPLDGMGRASFSTSSLSAANHFLTARYGGDALHGPARASRLQVIHAGASATTVNATPNPSAAGQAVTLTATVAAVPPASGTPTEMVTFRDGNRVLAQLALTAAGATGTASFTTTALAAGARTLTADYASDSHFAASHGSTVQTVSPKPGRLRTVPPCRVLDTRNAPGPWGGPALAAGAARTFTLAGRCGIPASALAVSANLTIVVPSVDGFLRVHAADLADPGTSALNFRAGQVRANNAVLTVAQDGTAGITVRAEMGGGEVHFLLDVNGYFAP